MEGESYAYVVECDRIFVSEGDDDGSTPAKRPKRGSSISLASLDESDEASGSTPRSVCYQFRIGDAVHTGDAIKRMWIYTKPRHRPFPSHRTQARRIAKDDSFDVTSGTSSTMDGVTKGLGRRDALRVMLCFMGVVEGENSSQNKAAPREEVKSILIDWSDFSSVPSSEKPEPSKTDPEGYDAWIAKSVSNELALLDAFGNRIYLPINGVKDSDLTLFAQVSPEFDRRARVLVVCEAVMLGREAADRINSEPARWCLPTLESRLVGTAAVEEVPSESPPTSQGCCGSVLARRKGSRAENGEKKEGSVKRPRNEPPGSKILVWDPTADPGCTLKVI